MFVNVELIYNNTYKFIQFTYKVPKKYENKIYIGTIVELLFRNKKYRAVVVDVNKSIIINKYLILPNILIFNIFFSIN